MFIFFVLRHGVFSIIYGSDKTLPGLDDLDDLDPALAAIINDTIESEMRDGPRLASSKATPPAECLPPAPSGVMQSARVLLSQLGLLNSHSLKVHVCHSRWGTCGGLSFFKALCLVFQHFHST